MQTHKCAFLQTIKDHLLVKCYMQLIKVIEIGAVPEFTDTSTVEETDGHPRTGEVIIAFEPGKYLEF